LSELFVYGIGDTGTIGSTDVVFEAFAFIARNSNSEIVLKTLVFASTANSGGNVATVEAMLLTKI